MTPFHFTTGSSTPALTLINGGVSMGLMGAAASSVEATNTVFLKLWWQKNGAIPIIGTTSPDVTIQIPTTGLAPFTFNQSLNAGGACYVAVTQHAADTDDTAVTAGDVVTLFLA